VQLLAHSGRRNKGVGPQTYAEHVASVRRRAVENMKAALRYRNCAEPELLSAVECASLFHDLGKLDARNQEALRTEGRSGLPVNHVDAGVAYLRSVGQVEAALAVYAHHVGLCDLPSELAKDQLSRQDPSQAALRDARIKLETDGSLPCLLEAHQGVLPDVPDLSIRLKRRLNGFERRLLLSCLVDADHGDSARHYGDGVDVPPAELRWEERLHSLDDYVRRLGKGASPRDEMRRDIYAACRRASVEPFFYACDCPVGSGKTTAVMAYLLRAALELNLRHIFVVLPFINVIHQAVKVYREALVLPGENPEMVVGAHHHQAEFSDADLRHLTTLWNCPIIVTTAVQFFETLGASETVRLRKLHELPGSAVFVDEAHAAIPIHLWPFMWEQIRQLAKEWSCRVVLASGSLNRFWENPRIIPKERSEKVPPIVGGNLRSAALQLETRRVRYKSWPQPLDLQGVCSSLERFKGPRMVVLNTVQAAAVVARELKKRGSDVLHLSTALAPVDRAKIMARIEERLRTSPSDSWILVATSCVEAGVDLSFAVAFRERCRAASLVQIGGRVNRHGERPEGVVYDFIVNDPLLPQHPQFKHCREVVEELFSKKMWEQDITELMTYALEQEFKRYSGEERIRELAENEKVGRYPEVARLTRVIVEDTRLVVVDRHLASEMARGIPVRHEDLIANSVRLWKSWIERLALKPVGRSEELFGWIYDYDPECLGIMEGILEQLDIDAVGGAVI